VVGTSAVVYPAAGLIALARGAVVEVNLEPTAASAQVAISLYGKAGEILPQLVPPAP
jgi:NAD-dependent deacetylase